MKKDKFVKINSSKNIPVNLHFLRIIKKRGDEIEYSEFVDEYSSMAKVQHFYKRNSNIVIYGHKEN